MKGSAATAIVTAIIIVIVLLILAELVLNNYHFSIGNYTIGGGNQTVSLPGGTTSIQYVPQGELVNYTLSLINAERANYSLAPVTLSSEQSAQQHSQSMLAYDYFSHWDIYGIKPYMRYTLEGGRGAVQENVAFQKNSGGLNPEAAIASLENSMLYNDSAHMNGHRDNILNANHTSVSIGIAYNGTTLYLTEDFINDYINWYNNTPAYSNGQVTLLGSIASGYKLGGVQISYDAPLQNMSRAQLDNTSDYGYGATVAGVVSSPSYYYKNIVTIDANKYQTSGSNFDVEFGMGNLTKSDGPGEYTLLLFLNNTKNGQTFIGSTYTIFINSTGGAYTPTNV